ncbi:PIR protein [Plasmodium vivax]|uniref:VIR protein n=1 Tax=Plasmodium vivax TaxID=5855 RepID=A0A565A584_PLAVI|nr:PIR protein [Plasmodium vivax]
MEECNSDFRNALKSYAIYNVFNKPVEVDGENRKCEELSTKLHTNKNFKKFCYMLSKNVTKVCEFLELPNSTSENCEFLNYWLYDALIKINFLNDENIKSQSSLMDKISELWDASNYNKKCDLIKYNINTTDFMHMKALYDYSKHISAIEDNHNNHKDEQCRKQYCSYMKKVKKVYGIVNPLCTPQNNKPYCEILRKIPQNKIPSVFLQNYECTDDEMNDDFIKYEKIFTNPLLASAFEDSDNPSVQQEAGDTFHQPISGQGQNSPEGSSSNSPVKVGLSLTGISFFPLLLIYKFTPAGNLLRRVINKKIGTNYNTGEIPSGDWFSISRAHQNDIQANREFNVLYQNMEKK